MTIKYYSSTGPKVIAEMGYHNLKNALAKLEREQPDRITEIAALAGNWPSAMRCSPPRLSA